MTEKEQTEHFMDELNRLIVRFSKEYQISYAAVIGCLQIKSHTLIHEALKTQQGGEQP